MSVETYLRSITFSGGTAVDVPQSGVLVLVGPNNTGKSAALREIQHHFTGHGRPADHPYRVITAVDLAKEGDADDLREWLEEHSHAFTIRSSGKRRYTRPGAQVMWGQAQGEWAIPNVLGPALSGVFCFPALTEQRLNLIAGASHWNPMEESPSAPLQVLFAQPELEEQISEIAREAFNAPLHLSRFPGGPIDLYVGTPVNEPSATSISDAYIEEIRTMPRSYVNKATACAASSESCSRCSLRGIRSSCSMSLRRFCIHLRHDFSVERLDLARPVHSS